MDFQFIRMKKSKSTLQDHPSGKKMSNENTNTSYNIPIDNIYTNGV